MHTYYYYQSYSLGYDLMSFLLHVLIIALVVVLVIWLLRSMGMGGGMRRRWMHMHSAISILDERYAKGEIDKAEYEERKKALMS